jgi:HK97 family phage portal protein
MEFLNKIVKFIKRSRITNLGPAKDWKLYQELFGTNQRRVSHETSLSIPAYFRALSILSEQIASLPFSIYETKADGNVVEAISHPLYSLIKYRPSSKYDTFSFREAIIRQAVNGSMTTKSGNVLIIPNRNQAGNVIDLHLVDVPWEMYKINDEFYYKLEGSTEIYSSLEVLHIKSFSENGYWGKSLIEAGKTTLSRALHEIDYGNDIYAKGTNLSGTVETDLILNEDQLNVIKKSWADKHSGPNNQQGVAFLQAGFKFKPIASRLEAADIDARKLTIEDISNLTGVPGFLLLGNNNISTTNIEILNRIFVQYTLRAWTKRIENEFNTKLFPQKDWGKYYVKLDLDELYRGDVMARAEFYTKLYNIRAIAPNEIRNLEGFNPYEGGDKFGMPLASNSREVPAGEQQNNVQQQ